MARYCASARASGAGSNTLPICSLYATASGRGRIVEIAVTNTTAVALCVALCRLTTAGTQGSSVSAGYYNPDDDAPICTAYNTHTGGPTLAHLGGTRTIGAAAGAGAGWTFGAYGLVIPKTANYGIGVYVPTGTGQVLDWEIVWDE